MDPKMMTSPCGLPCFECIAFKANSNEKLKRFLSKSLKMDYDNAECQGCRSENGKCFLAADNKIFPEGNCSLMNEQGHCYIFQCVQSKQLHNCSECDDFPCDRLQPTADRSTEFYHNLKSYNLSLIKKMGLEKWAKEKASKVWLDYMDVRLGK